MTQHTAHTLALLQEEGFWNPQQVAKVKAAFAGLLSQPIMPDTVSGKVYNDYLLRLVILMETMGMSKNDPGFISMLNEAKDKYSVGD